MAYAHAALDHERLPWLTNERKVVPPRSDTPLLLSWGLVALAVVGGASYWIGTNSIDLPSADSLPSATVWLPEPVEAEPAPEPKPVVAEAEPAETKVAKPAPRRQARNRRKLGPMESDSELPAVVASQNSEPEPRKPDPTLASRDELTYWPASESEGAAGRVVRIGTFKSRYQAKRAWWKVVKVYPGMKSLKAVVAPVPSERNGRTYYRLQFGTTSQAHSEVLCQRMLIVRVSCSVVGLPQPGGSA